MATKIKDIAVRVGSYEKDGQQKYRYRTIGAIMKDDEGHSFISLDVLALDSKLVTLNARATKKQEDRMIMSLFDPQNKDQQAGGQKTEGKAASDDDDIPF